MPTQNMSISGELVGISYLASETWTVSKGVTINATSIGVESVYPGSGLINKGVVIGGIFGVHLNASDMSGPLFLENHSSGEIAGGAGVVMHSFVTGAQVTNAGKMSGEHYGVYLTGSSNIQIANTGEIVADTYGVYAHGVTASSKGVFIRNDGEISAGATGIGYFGDHGLTTTIVNGKGAHISGANLSVYVTEKILLKNDGKLTGDIWSGTYNDKIVNKGNIKGEVHLGLGDDVFQFKGKKAKAGMIDTGDGNDKVVFGKKADKLVFSTSLDAATNVDTLKKFKSGKDELHLDQSVFSALSAGSLSKANFRKGKAAKDADDHIIYDKKSGKLFYDADGAGGAAQVQFAKLDKGAKLKAADFTVGDYLVVT